MSAIALKRAKLLVPEGYLQKVLDNNKNGLGFALHDGKEPAIALERGMGPWDLKTIQSIQDSYKDCGIIFNFMNLPEKAKMEDLQPFVVLGDEKNAAMVGFAEGNFYNFIPSGSDHANEYFLFNKFIIPKIKKIFELCKGDMAALIKELNDPVTRLDFLNTCNNRGMITLLTNTGETIMFDSGHTQYEWGIVSNNYDYKEEPVVAKEETKKSSKVMEFLKRKKEAAQGAAKGPIIASTDPIKQPIAEDSNKHALVAQDDPAITPAKTDTAVRPDSGTEWTEFTPPNGLSKRQLKKVYRRMLGRLPADWEQRPTVRYRKQPILKDFKDLDKAVAAQKNAEPAVTDKLIPILSPKVIEAIIEDMGEDGDKSLDSNSRKIMNLEEIAKYVNEHPDFEEATGISNEVTDLYDDQKLGYLAFKYPMAMLILAKNWRARAIEAENMIRTTTQAEVEESKVDTSGTGVVNKTVPKWKQAIAARKEKVAM